MGDRMDRLVVEVNKEDVSLLSEWKRLCMFMYGNGGIKKRIIEIIKKDLKTMKKEDK